MFIHFRILLDYSYVGDVLRLHTYVPRVRKTLHDVDCHLQGNYAQGKMLRERRSGVGLVHALREERREPQSLQGLSFCVAVIFFGSTH